MRIDQRLKREDLNSRQICFIECWGSLSHKDSLDTDRVSFNNILNSINEITYLYTASRISKRENKRRMVAGELVAILQADTSLSHPHFKGIPGRLKELLEYKDAWEDLGRSPIEKKRGLIENFFKELTEQLIAYYIPVNIDLLSQELAKTSVPEMQDYAIIVSLCNNIMSFMLTIGIPLRECNLLHSRILLNHVNSFDVRFDSWKEKVQVIEQDFTVRFSMENNKLYDMLTGRGQQTSFNGCTYNTYINNKNKKITHAEIMVRTFSVLAAKEKAEIMLKDSLDVVAYMLGSGNINKHQAFSVTNAAGEVVDVAGYSNEILTNSDRLTLDEFGHFMQAMSSLYSKSSLVSSRKCSAAFRFLRGGLATETSEENRFSAYWSALESLTLGVSSENLDHDDHVNFTTPACMGFDYVVKQLIAIRGICKLLDIRPNLQDGTTVTPGTATLHEIFLYLKDTSFMSYIKHSMQEYPYPLFTIEKFASTCVLARDLGKKIISHEKKVSRHLYRLYILRNAIAHNAESNPYIVFLTANLEHYLRGTINAMFYASTMTDAIDSPESAFQRYLDMHEVALRSLEPTYGIEEKEHNLIKGMIFRGEITPNDELLRDWIKLHN